MKQDDGSHANRGPDNLNEQIIAYLTDEMAPAERKAFEQAMQADEALRQEMETCHAALNLAQEWALELPPGCERVAEIAPPGLPVATRVRRQAGSRSRTAGRRLWRALSAAAIFILGFTFGRWPIMQPTAEQRNDVVNVTTPAATEPALTGVQAERRGSAPTKMTPESSPVPLVTETRGDAEVPELQHCAPTYTTEQDGRVIVETTLCRTGSRATWVVDGGFQLAQNTRIR